jgi:hypothetical protein
MSTPSPEDRIAAALELIAKETGGAHWSVAAAAVKDGCRNSNSGRPAIDDSDALDQIAMHVASGECVETAARWAANAMSSATEMSSDQDRGSFKYTNRATARRLARKFRAQAQN